MSHLSKIFSRTPVEVQNKSGFDMSFENLFSAQVGTLVPVLTEEILPNDSFTLGSFLNVTLPPMATEFLGRVDARLEAFFVPARLLYGGWQELITHPVNGDVYPDGTSDTTQKAKYLPQLSIPANRSGAQSLTDYLGCKLSGLGSAHIIKNPLPYVAYHKIWDDWYRDSRIQRSCFGRSSSVAGFSMPYITLYGSAPQNLNASLADGKELYDLRQRNFAKDYFTNASPLPQAGQESRLTFNVDDSTGSFSISALRAANSLQKWLERNNIAGYRYADQIQAQFGITPSDATVDRAIYLGGSTINVYTKGIEQTSNSPDSLDTNNVFKSVGATYGRSRGIGDNSLVDSFTATEHGYLMVMFSLVPHAYYGTGSRRYLDRSSSADFAFPLLASVGDQAIYTKELTNTPSMGKFTFGYTQRYSEYKYHEDEVHGLLRDGSSLESFALQRGFTSSPTLGSNFIEIPTDFMDSVSAVGSEVGDFGCWGDIYFTFKMSRALPAYSIPTLGDDKDTHTEFVESGGKRL